MRAGAFGPPTKQSCISISEMRAIRMGEHYGWGVLDSVPVSLWIYGPWNLQLVDGQPLAPFSKLFRRRIQGYASGEKYPKKGRGYCG